MLPFKANLWCPIGVYLLSCTFKQKERLKDVTNIVTMEMQLCTVIYERIATFWL